MYILYDKDRKTEKYSQGNGHIYIVKAEESVTSKFRTKKGIKQD